MIHSPFVFVPLASVDFALANSNLPGKVIVVVLLVGSVFVWSLMLAKLRQLTDARRASDRFLGEYRKAGSPLALFLRRTGRTVESPLQNVYHAVCEDLYAYLEMKGKTADDLFAAPRGAPEPILDRNQTAAVRNLAERKVADLVVLFENNMGMLATATTTAPFLGLLGTVWGVMDAFGGMVTKGSAMLSAVAPGISGALLTTVVGLLVALPSAIGYNTLSDKIRRLTVQTDNFAQELVSDVERLYGA